MSTPPTTPARRMLAMMAQHPALGLTVGYLVVSLLGMSYEWTLFRRFGVNFFHYADVTDFLMGAFREPITLVLALTALAVGALTQLQIEWEDRWFATREVPSRILRGYRRYSVLAINRWSPLVFFVGYSVMFIWLYSAKSADAIRAGDGERVTVMLVDTGTSPNALPATLLGTSSRFIFLFDSERHLTSIVPNENIAWIRVDAPVVPR